MINITFIIIIIIFILFIELFDDPKSL